MTLPNAQNDAVADDGADPDVFLLCFTRIVTPHSIPEADAANVENLHADVEILSKCSRHKR